MNIQSATTGDLQSAQNIVIAQSRFTMEHNMPCVNLIEKFTLGKGEYQLTLPKVGQMTAYSLTDGQPYPEGEDIGMTTQDMTTSEVGTKVIVSRKLARQQNEDVFKLVGKQIGDAMARKKDNDVIALFSALNGGTLLGADNKNLSYINAANCIVYMTAQKAPPPISVVHHPNAIGYLTGSLQGFQHTSYWGGVLQGLPEDLLRNFWRININGANVFHDGNIEKVTGYDSGYGAVFSKSAMAIVESLAPMVERDYDIDYRSWILTIQSDYGVYEIDDGFGAGMQYEIGTLATNN